MKAIITGAFCKPDFVTQCWKMVPEITMTPMPRGNWEFMNNGESYGAVNKNEDTQ